MENELYRSIIVPSRNSKDGETPTMLHVTKEINGYGVFLTDATNDVMGTLVKWFSTFDRNSAIEYGVAEAERLRGAK